MCLNDGKLLSLTLIWYQKVITVVTADSSAYDIGLNKIPTPNYLPKGL